jgi:LCP family protein required for cell wall assembly
MGRRGTCLYSCDPRPRVGAPQEPMATQTPPTPPPTRARPKMTIYGGGRPPKRRKRRWVRIALWTFGSIFVVLLACVAVVAYWLYGDYTRITGVSKDVKVAENSLQELPQADAPAIALVIGSDHRAADGSSPSRSDTFMLVRIDPKRHLVSLLSFPRDLWVDIPGFGQDRINAAFSDGAQAPGSSPTKLALETVKNLTGLNVNYVAVVDFRGFSDLVNEVGGVYLPVDEYYLHTRAMNAASGFGDQYAAIDIKPGYQLLYGRGALAFSRYRHTDSDFYRNARQQTFLRAFEQRAASRFHGISITDLPDIRRLLETVSRNVQIGAKGGAPSWRTFVKYATLAPSLAGHFVSSRLEATTGMEGTASVVFASPEAVHKAVYDFTHPQTLASPINQLPTGKQPKKPKNPNSKFKPSVPPASVSLSVLNGTTKTGEAADTATALGGFGYPTSSSNADTQSYTQTWVYYRSGFQKAAADVQHILGVGQTGPLPGTFSGASADVVTVLGTDYGGKLAIHPPKKASSSALPSTITPDNQVYLQTFRDAAHRAHIPGMYPTVTQSASEFVPYTTAAPIRTYVIHSGGHGYSSLYAMFRMPGIAGAYWGIEETGFRDAPILANSATTRRLDGRVYRFYYNGQHLHLVAFEYRNRVYWVINTLLDDLTNPEMVAIARSLRPTG